MRPAIIIPIGTRFGRLVTVAEPVSIKSPTAKKPRRFVECECDCGAESKLIDIHCLREGRTVSCGCYRSENASKMFTKHNKSGSGPGERTRLYRIWLAIRSRCTNQNVTNYRWYGGKGVRVCPEWDYFPVFEAWALSHGYKDGLTIDREDTSGDYEPRNCSWITMAENRARMNVARTRRLKDAANAARSNAGAAA